MNLYDVLAGQGTTHFERLFSQRFAGGAVQTLTGQPPLSFKADGTPLISWSMLGNGQQNGTPSPDNIIMPTFCGKLVGTDWTIPITCAGQTVPVYLGQTPTVRRVKKLVLTGEERWGENTSGTNTFRGMMQLSEANINFTPGYCSHLVYVASGVSQDKELAGCNNGSVFLRLSRSIADTLSDFKAYLAAQYAAGTPVTVWYVLAEPETAIVNEPLCKIGDYADELHSADAGVTIPTIKGSNVLTVESELQPSEMTITYKV